MDFRQKDADLLRLMSSKVTVWQITGDPVLECTVDRRRSGWWCHLHNELARFGSHGNLDDHITGVRKRHEPFASRFKLRRRWVRSYPNPVIQLEQERAFHHWRINAKNDASIMLNEDGRCRPKRVLLQRCVGKHMIQPVLIILWMIGGIARARYHTESSTGG